MSLIPLILTNETILNTQDIEKVYAIFKRDFIDTTTYLSINQTSYKVSAKPHRICVCPFNNAQKPERFWHIITSKELSTTKKNNPCPADRERNRAYSGARAKRVHWIKQTIDNLNTQEHIKYFYEDDQEPVHFLWDTKRFYMVLVKQLGQTDSLLVTAFPVHKNKYRDYKIRLNRYEKNL